MAKYQIFEIASVPWGHRGGASAQSGAWLTWSNVFRKLAVQLHRKSALKQRAFVKCIRGCAPYSASYQVSIENLPGDLRAELLEFATNLSRSSVGANLWFFRDMLVPPFDAGRIRVIFAALRAALVTLAKDNRAALYSPVTPEKKDAGFSLHADLFITTYLWLIFEEVPEDGTGASLFLSRDDLLKTLESFKTIPHQTTCQVVNLMTNPLARDSFDKSCAILHGGNRVWHESLGLAMREKATTISFGRGEGYLIDDRRWLHGRTPASQGVTARRFHRLTFGVTWQLGW